MRKTMLTLFLVLCSSVCLPGGAVAQADSDPKADRNVGMVIREIKNSPQGPDRVELVKYVDAHYPTDEKVIDFCLEVIGRRDWLMLRDLSEASHVRSPRLVGPLMEWIRLDRGRSHASHFVLVMLRHQRPVMADRGRIAAELGQVMLAQSRWFGPTASAPAQDQWIYWRYELDDLALTGDPALIPILTPWLDRRDMIDDAALVAILNNGVSTRVCDATYNALSVLLGLPSKPLSPFEPPKVTSVEAEYTRRNALIEQLRKQLAAEGGGVAGMKGK